MPIIKHYYHKLSKWYECNSKNKNLYHFELITLNWPGAVFLVPSPRKSNGCPNLFSLPHPCAPFWESVFWESVLDRYNFPIYLLCKLEKGKPSHDFPKSPPNGKASAVFDSAKQKDVNFIFCFWLTVEIPVVSTFSSCILLARQSVASVSDR